MLSSTATGSDSVMQPHIRPIRIYQNAVVAAEIPVSGESTKR